LVYRRTLVELTDFMRVIYFDQRGNGRSVPADIGSITMPQLADDVAGLADALDIDQFLVFGHSYGGFVAQEVALRHGNRLDGVVLVATTPGQLGTNESADDDQGPPPPAGFLEKLQARPATDEEFAAGTAGLLPYYLHRRDPAEVEVLLEDTVYRVDAMSRGFEVLSEWSSVDRLHEITTPTLVMVGRHDVATSYPQAYRIANRIPDAEVVVFENSGHFPWLEEPEAFFTTLQSWYSMAQVRRIFATDDDDDESS
jgi:proline iminopeptidase